MKKILSSHPTLLDDDGTHDLVFKLAIFAVIYGFSEDEGFKQFEQFLTTRKSVRYPDVPQHFRDSYRQVSGAKHYRFSCAAMRNAVKDPLCSLCPYNKDPSYRSDDPFWNISIWNNQYCLSKADKDGNVFRNNVTSFYLDPIKAGVPEGEEDGLWVSFQANCIKPRENPHPVVIQRDKLNAVKDFVEHVQEQVPFGVGYSETRASVGSGIREILMKMIQNLPHYLDAKMSQGLHKFKGDWYYVDFHGCRNKNWEKSGNALVADTITNRFRFGLSKLPYTDPSGLDYIVKSMQEINAEHVIYPLMCYAAASFFCARFRDIATRESRENLKNFPSLYVEGLAGSGKSETLNKLIRKIYGCDDDMEELAGKTPYILRTAVCPTTNGFPVFLDEVKEDMINSKEATNVGPNTLKEIIRSSWDGAEYMRGDYQADEGMRRYRTDAPLIMAGPSLPSCFDQAMRDRVIVVSMIQRHSTSRKSQWIDFLSQVTSSSNPLGRIGVIFLTKALNWDDASVLKVLDRAAQLVKKYGDGMLEDRKFSSLVKFVFGALVWYSIWKPVFNLELAIQGCLKSFGITDNFKIKVNGHAKEEEAVPQEQEETQTPIVYERRVDDWDSWMEEVLLLCDNKAEVRFKLDPSTDFWFDWMGDTPVFVLDIQKATEKYSERMRLGDRPKVKLSIPQIMFNATAKNLTLPYFDGLHHKSNVKSPKKNLIFKGPFVAFSVRALEEPENKLQAKFNLLTIPGYKDKPILRPMDDNGDQKYLDW